jgi:hypothetical protein
LDSVYDALKFHDTTLTLAIAKVIVFGHTDTKGSKRSNQLLSEKRAEYVAKSIRNTDAYSYDIVMGFGENNPVASNKTAAGRASNRRVEVTLIYTQAKRRYIPKIPLLSPRRRDTLIVFEDSTRLYINLADYDLIKKSISYQRHSNLFDMFETLAENDTYDTFYNFGSITLGWDSFKDSKCLQNEVTLSIKVPDVLVNQSMKELKAYAKQFKKNTVYLVKRTDGKWYLNVSTYCPFHLIGCGFHLHDKYEQREYRKIKYIAKNGYRILGAFMKKDEVLFNYKKVKGPRKKVKFKVICPNGYPEVSIVAVHEKSLDTLYYAEGTEQVIAHGRRCAKCDQKEKKASPKTRTSQKKDESLAVEKVKNRFLRKKYKFKKGDFKQMIVRKKVKTTKK